MEALAARMALRPGESYPAAWEIEQAEGHWRSAKQQSARAAESPRRVALLERTA